MRGRILLPRCRHRNWRIESGRPHVDEGLQE